MIKLRIAIVSLLFTAISWGQKNVFLSNEYWKKNPTVQDVKEKIKGGNSVLEMNSRSFDATALAILEGAPVEVVDYLVSLKEVPVDRRTHDGRTYLIWAAYKGNYPMVKMLIEKGADVNLEGSHGYNAINFAAFAGVANKELYEVLIKNGADIKMTNHDGANAMQLIMSRLKDVSLISYFESKGLSVKDEDNNGIGAFCYAARGGNIPVMEYLLEKDVNPKKTNEYGVNAAIFAAKGTRRGVPSLKTFKFLASKDVSLNVTDKEGNTPLLLVSGRTDDISLISYFLEQGIDVNQVNKEGNTAFINAASRSDKDILDLLLVKVKDVNHANNEGVNALARAVKYNSSSIVSYLLEKGASLNLNDKEGNSLLYYWVASVNNRSITKTINDEKLAILGEYGFDVTKSQPNGNNLFHLAVETENFALLEKAAELKIDINAKNNDGYTPLLKAALIAKDTKILHFLVDNGAAISIATDFDETAYDLASENELLTKQKAQINFLK
ncbi:ankyrin repeat domain-containing protein [Neptunitalea chrysea]|nr:ankyrin repeat domain-containing protein [Neptunitalea chrysea]